jgi:copper chaperone CopZ
VITRTYDVAGMTCEHCVRAVRDELTALPGVAGVAVELAPESTSTVTVTSASPLTDTDVAAALDEAGGYQLA